jgi:hypothetical protein
MSRSRRPSKDYEYLTASAQSMVYLTMLRLMLAKLAKAAAKQETKTKEQKAA